MAQIAPFHAYRYSPEAGPLEKLLTQPYDKISPEMQQNYLEADPHNLVRVILGPKHSGDNETDNVYTRAAAYFADWIREGILCRETVPALFPYSQEFQVPGTRDTAVRLGLIALGEVVDYAAGIVHRHEQTLSGPKKDRLQVLQHTGAHFGQIFMLYPDERGEVEALVAAGMEREPLCQVQDEYGVVHRLGRIADAAAIAAVQRLMSDKKLLIADGHHRYETALAYREQNPDLPGARFVMMTLVNMYSPGLRILGTHRVVRNLDGYSRRTLQAALPNFRFRPVEIEEARGLLDRSDERTVRIGVADAEGLFLMERPRGDGELDVAVLHGEVLDGGLGIGAEAVREEKFLRYIRGLDAAIEEVQSGQAPVAFLLAPAAIEQVARVSFGGGVMPQKSTDFYPKLLTGMAIYRLADGLPV